MQNIPKKLFGIMFAIIGLLVGVWYLPKQANEKMAEANSLVTTNKGLAEQEAKLVDLQNNMAQYQADTEKFNKESREILEAFPTFMFLEDKILYADEMQKVEMSEFNLDELNYGASVYVMSTSYSDSSLMELYSVACMGKFKGLTYPQFKKLLVFGQSEESSQRFVLDYAKTTYDPESGYLSGEFSYKTYFIAGQEDPYVFDPSILELIGEERRIDDLFGTREGAGDEEEIWDEEYGDVIDDVLNDIIQGEDFEIIDG